MTMQSRLENPVSIRLSRNGHVISADQPLLQLHFEAGGRDQGELALPQLLALARQSMAMGMRLSRAASIADASRRISLWCDVTPSPSMVEILVRDWQEEPLAPYVPPQGDGSDAPALWALSGDGHVRLDAEQRIVRITAPADVSPGEERDYLLKHWSEYFAVADGMDGHRPWQVFQIHSLAFPGDERQWRVEVVPDMGAQNRVLGFDLVLSAPRAAKPDGAEGAAVPRLLDDAQLARIFGTRIGPALRRPIGRIIANAETIGGRLDGPIRAEYANYASDIAAAGRHLLTLVDDLADLEAIESSGFRVESEAVDLSDVARRAGGLLALKASDHRIRLDLPRDDELMPVIGEFRRVLQILLNLIGNAIAYSPDGSVIWVRLDESDDMAAVIVADQGPGMSDEEQAKLFRKWERLGRSGDGGSGLGLYISRRLAEAMGGTLTVQSAPGQGARFRLELPKNADGASSGA
ncbi:MAG: HAMP domain-containing sensor histidine kinase [Blastomonas sp.]